MTRALLARARRSGRMLVTAVGAVALGTTIIRGGGVLKGQVSESDPALRRFESNVAEYMTIRREIARSLPPLTVTADSAEILRASDALAYAIRAARPAARAGDVFTTAARPVLLAVIRHTLRDNRIPPEALLKEFNAEVEPGTPRPAVNGRFPWMLSSTMPPCLLAALPPLPAALQYRFVGRDLMLVDLDADLVIDILVDALPIT